MGTGVPRFLAMASQDYIPAGRTSTVKKGSVVLHVQTEYAFRPVPRITTTILDNGRVLHKIERALEAAVSTPEEQTRTEATLLRQHAEVIAIIQNGDEKVTAPTPVPEPVRIHDIAVGDDTPVHERLQKIPGVQKLFRLDNDGSFRTDAGSEQFRKSFGGVFKNLRQLMDLFDRSPEDGSQRRRGVYEIERDRLYFASSGRECYFLVVRRINVTTQYEAEIKAALDGE